MVTKYNGVPIDVKASHFSDIYAEGCFGATTQTHTSKFKYVLCPGPAKVHGKTVYISGLELARLYGLDYNQCGLEAVEIPTVSSYYKDVPRLFPRSDGNYDLDNAVKEWQENKRRFRHKGFQNPKLA